MGERVWFQIVGGGLAPKLVVDAMQSAGMSVVVIGEGPALVTGERVMDATVTLPDSAPVKPEPIGVGVANGVRDAFVARGADCGKVTVDGERALFTVTAKAAADEGRPTWIVLDLRGGSWDKRFASVETALRGSGLVLNRSNGERATRRLVTEAFVSSPDGRELTVDDVQEVDSRLTEAGFLVHIDGPCGDRWILDLVPAAPVANPSSFIDGPMGTAYEERQLAKTWMAASAEHCRAEARLGGLLAETSTELVLAKTHLKMAEERAEKAETALDAQRVAINAAAGLDGNRRAELEARLRRIVELEDELSKWKATAEQETSLANGNRLVADQLTAELSRLKAQPSAGDRVRGLGGQASALAASAWSKPHYAADAALFLHVIAAELDKQDGVEPVRVEYNFKTIDHRDVEAAFATKTGDFASAKAWPTLAEVERVVMGAMHVGKDGGVEFSDLAGGMRGVAGAGAPKKHDPETMGNASVEQDALVVAHMTALRDLLREIGIVHGCFNRNVDGRRLRFESLEMSTGPVVAAAPVKHVEYVGNISGTADVERAFAGLERAAKVAHDDYEGARQTIQKLAAGKFPSPVGCVATADGPAPPVRHSADRLWAAAFAQEVLGGGDPSQARRFANSAVESTKDHESERDNIARLIEAQLLDGWAGVAK